MKRFLYIWLAWFCFLVAIVSMLAELVRYIIGDFEPSRAMWVCSISSFCLAVWWRILE